MRLPPDMVEGRLLRRYKRFLADVELEDGRRVTAHCPNPGAMTTCMQESCRVLLSTSDDPRRKLAFTWELSRMGRAWILVNTARTNALVDEVLARGGVPELAGYPHRRREVRCGARSRLDFRLEDPARPACWVEVKNVTLAAGGVAYFPDAVTERGRRHLEELSRLARRGDRAVLLLAVTRSDATRFRPARAIDRAYADALVGAVEQGVEVVALRFGVGPRSIRLLGPVPVEVSP